MQQSVGVWKVEGQPVDSSAVRTRQGRTHSAPQTTELQPDMWVPRVPPNCRHAQKLVPEVGGTGSDSQSDAAVPTSMAVMGVTVIPELQIHNRHSLPTQQPGTSSILALSPFPVCLSSENSDKDPESWNSHTPPSTKS